MSQIIARVNNQEIREIPKDLYIDPEALMIFLEMFEGPLDLLLYLIRKQNLDILDIPIATITNQYISYITAMTSINIDLAAEYLAMAANLLAIKSRMMLPKPPKLEPDEENSMLDPRVELINKLVEYETIKLAAQNISNMPMVERDYQWANIEISSSTATNPTVNTEDLRRTWQHILLRSLNNKQYHKIEKQELSIREYMSSILCKLTNQKETSLESLFNDNRSLAHIVVSFVAVLELAKEELILLSSGKNGIILALK